MQLHFTIFDSDVIMKVTPFPCLHPLHSADHAGMDANQVGQGVLQTQAQNRTSVASMWRHHQSGSKMRFMFFISNNMKCWVCVVIGPVSFPVT